MARRFDKWKAEWVEDEDDSGLWWWVLAPAGLILLGLLLDGAR